MVNIIEENRNPSFSERLMHGLGRAAAEGAVAVPQMMGQKLAAKQQNEAIQKQTGLDLSKLPPASRDEFIKQFAKASAKEQLIRKLFAEDTNKNQMGDQLTGNGTAQEDVQQGSQKQPIDFSNLNEEQRTKLSMIDPNVARQATEEAKLSHKIQSEKHGRHYDIAKKSLEHAAELSRTIPQKEASLEAMKGFIKEGNLSYFSPDNIAQLTGIDAFRTPGGAAFKTASKEFFLGNTVRIGAKGLNQWFEKQVLEMSPKIGQSKEANMAMTEMLDMEIAIQKKEVELTNQIADQMEKEQGFVNRNLPEKINTELSKYAVQRQKEAKSRIEEIKDLYEPVNKSGYLMRDPEGNLRRVSTKDYKEAKKAGYRVEK